MAASKSSLQRQEFTEEQTSRYAAAFDKAFATLKETLPTANSAEFESNNHFDEDFHQKLCDGLHLTINLA